MRVGGRIVHYATGESSDQRSRQNLCGAEPSGIKRWLAGPFDGIPNLRVPRGLPRGPVKLRAALLSLPSPVAFSQPACFPHPAGHYPDRAGSVACYGQKCSLFQIPGTCAQCRRKAVVFRGRDADTRRQNGKNRCIFPQNTEIGPETGSRETAPSANQSARARYLCPLH